MRERNNFYFAKIALIIFLLTLADCASTSRTLNPNTPGPQLVVSPEKIRLGVVTLRDINIVFQGAGFKPGDSVFLTLSGPKETKLIVAEAPIKADGTFKTSVPALTKIMEILKADVILDENFQNVVVISGPPVPEGEYIVKVNSMSTNLSAETKLTITGPNIIDKFKDWIGKITGKIRYK